MMKGNENGLYRFEEIEMLAYKVCEVFRNTGTIIDMTSIASERHSPKNNQRTLLAIYESVCHNNIVL